MSPIVAKSNANCLLEGYHTNVTPSLLSSLSPPFPLRYPSPLPSFPLSSLPPSLPIPPPILPSLLPSPFATHPPSHPSLSPPFPLRYPSPLPSFPLSSLPPSLPIPPPILPLRSVLKTTKQQTLISMSLLVQMVAEVPSRDSIGRNFEENWLLQSQPTL